MVQLTRQEADHADDVGARIAANARRHGWRDRWSDANSRRSHQLGARGELAVAKAFGLDWSPSFAPQGTRPDVGPYEVKTASMLATSYDDTLMVPAARCDPDQLFVAVRAWNRLDHDVVGWCCGADVLTYYEPVRPRPTWSLRYYVPYGDLRTLDTLP